MMNVDKRHKQDDDEMEISPFDGLQKNAVVYDAKVFHNSQIDPMQCTTVMTKILYLLSRGEAFSSNEASEIFFGVTKLFQSADVHLRRLTYLLIKELTIESDESLIVVSSLSKDMTGKTDVFRANAIRVLAKIIDASMLGQIDRFLRQAVVDKNTFVTSSALIAGTHLFRTSPDVLKRWVNETQAALRSDNKMVQFHALQLLYLIKQHDRLAISKVCTALARNPPSGPMAYCLLVRFIAGILAQQQQPDQELVKFLMDSLHSKYSMVIYEAARAICRLPNNPPHSAIVAAITALSEFLTSPLPTQRFAAVRTLSQVVVQYPSYVAPCGVDLQHLIADPNRSIATLAITTLLKTGVEANVDSLMKSITGFMSEISDEFKIVLVDAIKTLCLKFPSKHPGLMGFLATVLREEGGFAFKEAIVNAILAMISHIPEAKADGLDYFCEFIEDCEFAELAVRILHFLGEEGPTAANPAKYIRFIFNRVILEKPCVRCAAVSALASFGQKVPSLTAHVVVLLKRALTDSDDEVRDRVVYYLSVLEEDQHPAADAMHTPIDVPLKDLELSLQMYLEQKTDAPFNLNEHIVQAVEEEKVEEEKTTSVFASAGPSVLNPHLELLNSIPEFKELGTIFSSCPVVQLTEDESEYVVSCIKHIYPEHVVLQFNITNNMDDQQMENITVEVEPEDDEWTEDLLVPEPVIAHNAAGVTFVCMARPADAFSSGPMSCELKFDAKEVDPVTNEVTDDPSEESYQLEDLELRQRDFMKRGSVLGLMEFRKQWEALGQGKEQVKKYSLSLDDLQAAVDAVRDLLGMTACEESGVVPDDKRSHACNLYGVFLVDTPVFCRAGFMLDQNHGVTLKIAVRCRDPEVAAMLATCIR